MKYGNLIKDKSDLCVNKIHTNLSFVRISLTEDNCLVICAISASDSDKEINNCSRSGLR